MSRNGSGVYSLPGTYLATTGETIQAQQHNDPLQDLESDANTARPIVAGGTGATSAADARTNLSVPGLTSDNSLSGINTFSKIVKWSKGADVASANALTLGDDGNYFDITGTTAITSIGTKGVGTVVRLHFDGALTLTHDATALVLPGGANVTTAAGDEAEFVEYATGDWRCVNYLHKVGAVTITAGSGLTGGGILTADRTLAVSFASAAEILTGAEAAKSVSPATLAGNKLLSSSGYYKFAGGLIVQLGTAVGGSALSFPTSFPNGVARVTISGNSSNIIAAATSVSGTGFTPVTTTDGGSTTAAACHWIAVGY